MCSTGSPETITHILTECPAYDRASLTSAIRALLTPTQLAEYNTLRNDQQASALTADTWPGGSTRQVHTHLKQFLATAWNLRYQATQAPSVVRAPPLAGSVLRPPPPPARTQGHTPATVAQHQLQTLTPPTPAQNTPPTNDRTPPTRIPTETTPGPTPTALAQRPTTPPPPTTDARQGGSPEQPPVGPGYSLPTDRVTDSPGPHPAHHQSA